MYNSVDRISATERRDLTVCGWFLNLFTSLGETTVWKARRVPSSVTSKRWYLLKSSIESDVVSSLREWDFKEVVPGQNSIGRPKNVELEILSSSLRKRELRERERERKREKSAVDAGYSWKEDPPGDDTGPRASNRASVRAVRVCALAHSLARSRSTCVRPLTLRSPRATMPNHRIRRIRKTDRSAAGISVRPPPPTPLSFLRTRVSACMAALGWTPKRIRIIDRHGQRGAERRDATRRNGRCITRSGQARISRLVLPIKAARADFRRVDLRRASAFRWRQF